MADANNQEQEELNVVIIGDEQPGGGEQGSAAEGQGGEGQAEGEDEGHEVDLDDLEERAGRVDEELEGANTEAERNEIREQRKLQRKQRREQNRERFNSIVRENASLRQQLTDNIRRLLALEGNQAGAQLERLNQTAEGIDRAISALEVAIAEASSKQDGQTVALATRRMTEAMAAKKQVGDAIDQFKRVMNTPQQQPTNPELVRRSSEWFANNKWYKGPQSKERDSLILTAIDNSVAADGFDPTTKEYWDELNARMKTSLPHRANGADNSPPVNGQRSNTTPARRQPVAGGGNNGADGAGSSGTGKTFRLSRERYEAMKESGAWDDPVRRRDMIKRFQEMDAKLARERR